MAGLREAALRRATPSLDLKTFAALKYRDFRLLWSAQLGSAMAMQAEMIARSWLVLELTGSAAAVGLVHTTRAFGQLAIVPVAGVLADRVDRRYLMMAADGANAFFYLVLAFLIAFEQVAVWQVVASTIIAGAAMSVEQTSRQAIIPSIVPREGIMNAVSLSSVVMGSSRVLGPSLAGFMIAVFGVQGAYFVMAGFLILPVILPLFMTPIKISAGEGGSSFYSNFKEGLFYSLRTPAVRVVFLVAFTTVTFAMPFMQLLPVYVPQVLKMGPGTLGVIGSIPGLLTILGGLFAASLGDYHYKGRLLLIAVLSPCVAALIMSQTDMLWMAIFATCVFGLFSSQYQPSTQTALMKAAPRELHGRVNSLLSLSQGLGSVGVVFYGLLADATDIQTAYLFFGGLCAFLLLAYFAIMREFRELS